MPIPVNSVFNAGTTVFQHETLLLKKEKFHNSSKLYVNYKYQPINTLIGQTLQYHQMDFIVYH